MNFFYLNSMKSWNSNKKRFTKFGLMVAKISSLKVLKILIFTRIFMSISIKKVSAGVRFIWANLCDFCRSLSIKTLKIALFGFNSGQICRSFGLGDEFY